MDECYYYLWRDTPSKLWTPVLLINLIKPQPQTCNFMQTSLFLPHICLILLLQQAGGIDTLTVELGQNTLIVCKFHVTTSSYFLAPLIPRVNYSSPIGLITLIS